MVSRTPTKAPSPRPGAGNVTPTKATPSPMARRTRPPWRGRTRPPLRRRSAAKRRGSPLRSLASALAAVAATFDRSSSPQSPLPPLPIQQQAAVRVQSAALPPPPSPETRTLFLDLDDTLIHPQTDPPARFDFAVHHVIHGRTVTHYVIKRPGVDAFLRAAAESFEVVVFTAGRQEYASLVLDRLDPDGKLFAHRLYRDACRDFGDGCLVKDLAATGRALDRVIIVDDNPDAYALQPENAVPVASFVDDDNDQGLQRVMAFLDVAVGFDDTREAIRYYKDLATAT